MYDLKLPVFQWTGIQGIVGGQAGGLARDFNLFVCRFRVCFLHEWGGAGRAQYATGKPKTFLADEKCSNSCLAWENYEVALPINLFVFKQRIFAIMHEGERDSKEVGKGYAFIMFSGSPNSFSLICVFQIASS